VDLGVGGEQDSIWLPIAGTGGYRTKGLSRADDAAYDATGPGSGDTTSQGKGADGEAFAEGVSDTAARRATDDGPTAARRATGDEPTAAR
jgi:hypothetical protein